MTKENCLTLMKNWQLRLDRIDNEPGVHPDDKKAIKKQLKKNLAMMTEHMKISKKFKAEPTPKLGVKSGKKSKR